MCVAADKALNLAARPLLEFVAARSAPCLGMEHNAGHDPGAEPRFWFVLDVAIARDHAHPLAGLRPETILPALPRALAVSALRDALEWYLAHDGAQAMLAACRA